MKYICVIKAKLKKIDQRVLKIRYRKSRKKSKWAKMLKNLFESTTYPGSAENPKTIFVAYY